MGNNCCFALSSLTAIGAFGGASQTWTGSVTIQFNNGSPFSVSTQGRLTSTVISGASNWLDPSTQGIGGAGSPLAVIEVTNPSTFVVNNAFEILIGGNWVAFLPWYNSMDGNVYGSRASFGGQFWYTPPSVNAVPVPAALPLFATILAGGGFVAWRRKRKAGQLVTS
jgi:hypothetical protein